MCKFCEPEEWTIDNYNSWINTHPRRGDEQTWDGMDYLLFPDGTFKVGATFDGGYIHDQITFKFNFCPMCGKTLKKDL